MKDTLIVINNRDRLTPLCQLVTWLLDANYRNILVLDNDSTYPPLIEYYDAIDDMIQVVRLGKNLMSKALWCWTSAAKSLRGPFVYTDSDIVPDENCPDDVVEFLMRVADAYGSPNKIGLGLRIDDIPEHYAEAHKVRTWEAQMWQKQIGELDGVPVYSAGVDTTFAYYPELKPFCLDGIRVGAPYVARHVDWYVDSANPTEEQQYYEVHAAKGCHNWGITQCFSNAVRRYCEKSTSAE